MPLMQSIRKNAKFILLFMAFAFILWIFLELGMNIAGVRVGKPYQRGIIAEIDGKQISFDFYQNILNELIENERERKGELSDMDMAILRKRAWEELLWRVRFTKIQEQRDLIVDDNLLNTIIYSTPPPEIMKDPSFWKGDSFDVKKYREFLKDPASRQIVLTYARTIMRSYPIALMNVDITSALHITQEEVSKDLELKLTKYSFKYFNIRFYKIPAEIFKYNEDSLRKYYEKNKDKFKKKESFKIAYIFVKFEPSKRDTDVVIGDLDEIRGMILNEGLSFEEAIKTYSMVNKYKKDTVFISKEKNKKFKVLSKYKVNEVSKPEIIGDTVFLFKIIKKDKKTVKYKAIALLITTSYDTRAELREKAKNLLEIAKTEGLKKAAESYKMKYNQSKEIPMDLPFIPGIGKYKSIKEWIKKGKKGDMNLFWTPEGYYVIEILDKVPETYLSFDEAKRRVKSSFLRRKRKEFAEKIAYKILNGESYEKQYVEYREFKQVDFYKPVVGLYIPESILGALSSMGVGERRKIEAPGGIVVLELIEKMPPSADEISSRLNEYFQKYLSEIQSKVFNAFQSELKSEEGVKDYRSSLLE